MDTGVVFASGGIVGAAVALLGVATKQAWKKRRGTRVVMYSSQEQARELAGISTDEPAQRPRYLTTTTGQAGLGTERRQSDRPAQPREGWSDAGSWVDLGAPQQATVTMLHGDTHRAERRGGVIRFRRRSGEARDG